MCSSDLGHGKVAMDHDDATGTARGGCGSPCLRRSVEATLEWLHHLGTDTRGPSGHVVVGAHHEQRTSGGSQRHPSSPRTCEVLSLGGVKHLGEATLGEAKRLDGHDDGRRRGRLHPPEAYDLVVGLPFARVAVIGAGSWGTTVASLVAHNAPTVLWVRRRELADELRTTRENSRYLPGVRLHDELQVTDDLADAVSDASLVVVAEGARPEPGTLEVPEPKLDKYGREMHGSISQIIAPELSRLTGFESRVVQLGHVQRGGTPTSYDRVLSSRFGLAAVDAVYEKAFGEMVVLKCGQIERVSMQVTRDKTRTIDLDFFNDVSASFFG